MLQVTDHTFIIHIHWLHVQERKFTIHSLPQSKGWWTKSSRKTKRRWNKWKSKTRQGNCFRRKDCLKSFKVNFFLRKVSHCFSLFLRAGWGSFLILSKVFFLGEKEVFIWSASILNRKPGQRRQDMMPKATWHHRDKVDRKSDCQSQAKFKMHPNRQQSSLLITLKINKFLFRLK